MERAIPVIPGDDILAMKAFYIDKFGFTLILLVAAIFAQPLAAQAPLSAADSTALVNAVVVDLRGTYRAFVTGVFVVDTTNTTLDPLAARVFVALTSDSAASIQSIRTTPRASIAVLARSAETVTVSVTISQCRVEPREWFSTTSASHRYYRTNDGWRVDPARGVVAGDGGRCPH